MTNKRVTRAAPAETTNAAPAARVVPRRRPSPEDREHEIVQRAVAFFASNGFGASTRDLAKELGITQPLLYRYFPNKEALIDRVYEEVFVRRWNPEWEEWLADRSMTLRERLCRYLKDYGRFVLRSEWVRIFIYAGLNRGGINQKYLARLREPQLMPNASEMRREYGIPDPRNEAELEDELDLVWAMHSSVFYIGVRKWIYELPTPKNLDRVIDLRVEVFLRGVPAVLSEQRRAL